jgi:hypothetical protein
MERLGRLRERYPTIAQFYNVEVTVLAAPTSMKRNCALGLPVKPLKAKRLRV